ncbi:MAG: V-type ATP synthase subunit E [Clostridium sp.]|nr:V-type ATP synthase subunit E [Clostridium sp.]
MSVNNITSKILRDAEGRKESILATAEEEKNNILSKKVASAKELEKEILEKAEIEARSKRERAISGAKLKARNEKLAAKQEVIEEVFSKSVETLCKLSDTEFVKFVEDSILSLDIYGDESLVLNKDGQKIVSKEIIAEINAKLKSKGLKGEIKISETVGSFRGGFILEKGGVEVNNTFEALVSSLKDELEFEVAQVLFN